MIEKWDYRRLSCPYCRSPRLKVVAMIAHPELATMNQLHDENKRQVRVHGDHRQCQNCRRVFAADKIHYGFDRAGMWRDYRRLGKLLAKGGD